MRNVPVGLVITVVAVAVLPLLLRDDFGYDVAIRVGINAMVAVSLNLLIGYAGQVSLGHAGFFGIGGYGSAVLGARYGWDPILAMAGVAGASMLLAHLLARPILRLRGHYLAMGTLGLGAILTIVFVNESAYTGGPDGMSVPSLHIGPIDIASAGRWYALVSVFLLIVVVLAHNITRSGFGRAVRGLHGSDVAAQSVGVDTTRHKVAVFVFSACVATIAGSLSAHYIGFITPQVAGTLRSVEFVAMVVVGGMGSIGGSMLGAALFTVLPQLLTGFEGYELMSFGLILMVSLVVMPRGLGPSTLHLIKRLGTRSSKPESSQQKQTTALTPTATPSSAGNSSREA